MCVYTASVQTGTTEPAQQMVSQQTSVTQENSEEGENVVDNITTTPAPSDYIPPQTPPVYSGELILHTR